MKISQKQDKKFITFIEELEVSILGGCLVKSQKFESSAFAFDFNPSKAWNSKL